MAEPSLRSAWAASSRRQRVSLVVALATPWGILWLRDQRRQRKVRARIEANVVTDAPPADTRVEEAIRFLLDRGLDEREVRDGSMPEASLDYTAQLVSDHLARDRPVLALHVGNFVGVSLCYLSWLLRARHPGSVVVSVDPNLPHRGIEDPQAHALALLHHFGLLDNNLIVPGYTLEHTPGERASRDPEADYLEGIACERVLDSLERLCGHRFDLVLLDGNHAEPYLKRELAAVRRLLAADGIVVFDDVTEGSWDGVVSVFESALQDEAFVELGQDGRVGVVQVRAARGEASG